MPGQVAERQGRPGPVSRAIATTDDRHLEVIDGDRVRGTSWRYLEAHRWNRLSPFRVAHKGAFGRGAGDIVATTVRSK